MQSPSARLVRIMPPHFTAKALRAEAAAYARRPRRTRRSHDRQRASRPHYTTLARFSTHNVRSCQGSPEAAAYAHHVSQARMLSPCARLVRIMSPTALPRRNARRPRRTLHSHHFQRTSRKLSVHAAALCSPRANYFPHYIAQAAAYATLARSSTRIK